MTLTEGTFSPAIQRRLRQGAAGIASLDDKIEMTGHAIDRAEIEATERLIRPYIRRTPVIEVASADFGFGDHPIYLKLELMQHAGSFKCRGAFANLLTREIPAAGVVAASGGNHGAAVAFAAMKLGIAARIFVPSISSPAKVERIRQYGAKLVVGGDCQADALAASEHWSAQSGALPVHAFDQAETMLGQGTIGLELEDQAPEIDTLLVSIGGGGLIAGIAAWYAGRIKVVGVELKASPTFSAALETGRQADAEVGDGVFPIVRRYVDDVVPISDEAIRQAQSALWNVLRIVAEPGGSAAFAALLCNAYRPRSDERIGVVISGGNTTAANFSRCASRPNHGSLMST